MIRGLPYDAEVEYLESTGTQYFDTVVVNTDSVTWSGTIRQTDSSKACFGFGYRFVTAATYVGNMRWLFIYPDRRIGLRNGSYAENSTSEVPASTPFRISYDGTTVYVDSVPFVTCTARSTTSNYGVAYLLGINTTGYYNADLSPSVGRIYDFTISDNSTLVRDFIPVRVGQVGYMYDRVTRKLFGNSGTGSFIVGPDVATPVMGIHEYPEQN